MSKKIKIFQKHSNFYFIARIKKIISRKVNIMLKIIIRIIFFYFIISVYSSSIESIKKYKENAIGHKFKLNLYLL